MPPLDDAPPARCSNFKPLYILMAPRQGLTELPRKGAEAWPARCGGDLRSPRKPAGPDFRQPRSSPESPAAALNFNL
jgi:hypothetical protein